MPILGCDSKDEVRTTSCEEAAGNVNIFSSLTLFTAVNLSQLRDVYHPYIVQPPGCPFRIPLLSSLFQQPFESQPFLHIGTLHKPVRFICLRHHEYLG
jgi:hypothetical protein